MSIVLGTKTFSDVPDVNGTPVLLNAGNTPSIQSGLTASIPVAGVEGRMYLTSDTRLLYRDSGAAWEIISPLRQCLYGTIPYTTGTSIIPADTSTPTSTEGTLIFSADVTPAHISSKIIISFAPVVDSGTNGRYVTATVFRNSTCISSTSIYITTSGRMLSLPVYVVDAPNSTSSIKYSFRFGISSNATWRLAGSTSYTFGGTSEAQWTIMEIV